MLRHCAALISWLLVLRLLAYSASIFSFFGRPFVKRFALCYQTVVCPVCPVLSVTLVHCGQTVGRIKMKLAMQVGLGPGHTVLDGNLALPFPKVWRSPPIFGPYLLRLNGSIDQDATWYGGRTRPSDFMLDGDPAPLPKKGAEPPPQFSAHFYCGQTAGCIKMPLGTEVGLIPEDFMLDGHPGLPPKKGAEPPPQFSAHVYCGQTAGWIKMACGWALVHATLC